MNQQAYRKSFVVGAVAIGVIAGVAAAVALSGASIMMKRRKNQVKELKGKLAERDKPPASDD